MKIEKDSALPIYHQIKEYFKSEISRGKYKSGEALPSERKLSAEKEISIGTIRKAYDELLKEGIIERIQGKGTVVANTNAEKTILTMGTFSATIINQGLKELEKRWNSRENHSFTLKVIPLGRDMTFEEAYNFFDLLVLNDEDLPFLKDKDLSEPLVNKINMSSFRDGEILKNYKADPKLKALPLTYSPFVMAVNEKLLEQLGTKIPGEWTWESFKTVFENFVEARENNRTKAYAFSTSVWPYRWLPFLWQNGCDVFTGTGNVQREDMLEALKFCREIFKSPAFFSQNNYNMTIAPEELFAIGKIGMIFIAYHHLQTEMLELNNSWSLKSLPAGKTKATSIFSVPITVSAKSKNKNSALEFLNRIYTPEWQLKMLDGSSFMPVCKLENSAIKEVLGEKRYAIYDSFNSQMPFARSILRGKNDKLRCFYRQFAMTLSGLETLESLWDLYNEEENSISAYGQRFKLPEEILERV